MTDDEYLRQLRPHMAPLRHEPTPSDVARVVGTLLQRVQSPESLADWLARWLRPLVAAAVILAITAGLLAYGRGLNYTLQTFGRTVEWQVRAEVVNGLT